MNNDSLYRLCLLFAALSGFSFGAIGSIAVIAGKPPVNGLPMLGMAIGFLALAFLSKH